MTPPGSPAAARAATATLLVLLAGLTPTRGAAIEDQTLRYTAAYGRVNAGEVEINIRNENHGYVVTSTGKPSMLAAMFFKTHSSTTRFIRHRGEVALDSGTERLAGEGGYRRGFRFNRAHGRVEFSNGKHGAIQPGDRFEAAAFPLLLMLRPVESIAGARVREVSARRMRDYTYEPPVEEIVKVPAGAFPCWKINRHRTGRPTERVTVWLHKAENPIPLKIVVTKKGRTSTLELLE